MAMLSALVLAFVVSVGQVEAQQADARWAAWLGCWQMVAQEAREADALGAAAVTSSRTQSSATPDDVSVCVETGAEAPGATFTTRVAAQPVLVQTIVADGGSHPVMEDECRGIQRAEWSRDGRRLFTHAELACGEQDRRVSGLSMLEDDRTWLDVQVVEIAGRTDVRVRRYTRRTGGLTGDEPGRPPAVRSGGPPFGVAEIAEASTKLSPAALDAALIEARPRVNVDTRTLIALDEAGVSDSVIDLMVALAYPERFVVERRTTSDRGGFSYTDVDAAWDFWDMGYPYLSGYPWFHSSMFSRSYYAPFGFGAYNTPYYFYPRSVFAVDGSTPSLDDSGAGRVVNGLGYTSVRPRDASRVGVESSDGQRSNGSSGGRATMSTFGATQSSSGSSRGERSSGSSGGSSGSSGGRTAQPR